VGPNLNGGRRCLDGDAARGPDEDGDADGDREAPEGEPPVAEDDALDGVVQSCDQRHPPDLSHLVTETA
jgi:hypothetical protein